MIHRKTIIYHWMARLARLSNYIYFCTYEYNFYVYKPYKGVGVLCTVTKNSKQD